MVTPDYSEATKFADLWLNPKQGTDAALAMAMGHVILREYHLDRQAEYFEDYCRKYSDMPMLVKLVEKDGACVPANCCALPISSMGWTKHNNPDWKTVAIDEANRGSGGAVRLGRFPLGRGRQVEPSGTRRTRKCHAGLRLTNILDGQHDEVDRGCLPLFRQP